MLLSTIICPQYLRGWGSVVVFVCPHHPCRPPSLSTVTALSVAIPYPHHLHVSSHGREAASRHHIVIRPQASQRAQTAQNVLLMYYSHRCLCCNSLYISTLDALYMNPKGSQAFCFDDWIASQTHLGHTLDTPCSLGNRLIPPFHPPFRSLDHVYYKPSKNLVGAYTSLATANIRPISPLNAVFRLLSMSQKSHKSFCRGFNVKNPTF